MFLLIDKPKGITSHDVIGQLRKIMKENPSLPRLHGARIGHAGTLDPNATGLLIVGIGRESTKKLGSLTKNTKKTYEAEIFLGQERDTDDAEGEILRLPSVAPAVAKAIAGKQGDTEDAVGLPPSSKVSVSKVLKTFVGRQMQMPPVYSAIKIKGKKAYQLARRGKEVILKPRKVEVYSIKVLGYNYPILKIETEVSSGTYIRALARDIGRKLGCGAYLKNLRRTRIGQYCVEDAVTPEKVDMTSKTNKLYIINV